MNRLTGKECFSLREAYYSIYNQEIAEKLGSETVKNLVKTQLPRFGNALINTAKTQLPRAGNALIKTGTRAATGVKDEVGNLSNKLLFTGIPKTYRAGKEAIKTVGSIGTNAYRHTLGDRAILRNGLVQAGLAGLTVDNAVRGKNSVIAPVIDVINKFIKPNLNDNYQMDDDKFIIECLNLIANHLIEEKYASNEKAALKIIENMSEGWTHNILQNYLE